MIKFTAKSVPGSGRGASLGCPTINLEISDMPEDLEEGIYACFADTQHAVMHHGPRPVFNDVPSCEIHFLDFEPQSTPEKLDVTIVEKIREIANFESVDALKEKIQEDIERARAILSAHAG